MVDENLTEENQSSLDAEKVSHFDINSNKRKSDNSDLEPRRNQRVRREKTLDPHFIFSEFITFLVEGDRTRM